MNKQGKNGIEWVKTINPDGTETPGYTHNIIGGCKHRCAWLVEGKEVNCYAEDVATGIASSAYPLGFEHHYYHANRLNAPLSLKTPAKIFIGSMADVFGHWVPAEQIQAVLDMCRQAHWHTFQFLTKNPIRLKKFDFPPNCWVGLSAPPSFMNGIQLSRNMQNTWFHYGLHHLSACNARVKWCSFEPLSYDIAPVLDEGFDLQWAVIGAASSGKTKYQPDPQWVMNLLGKLASQNVPVFYKGNLRGNPAAAVWREEFPA